MGEKSMGSDSMLDGPHAQDPPIATHLLPAEMGNSSGRRDTNISSSVVVISAGKTTTNASSIMPLSALGRCGTVSYRGSDGCQWEDCPFSYGQCQSACGGLNFQYWCWLPNGQCRCQSGCSWTTCPRR